WPVIEMEFAGWKGDNRSLELFLESLIQVKGLDEAKTSVSLVYYSLLEIMPVCLRYKTKCPENILEEALRSHTDATVIIYNSKQIGEHSLERLGTLTNSSTEIAVALYGTHGDTANTNEQSERRLAQFWKHNYQM
ncbi:4522_t:CDS:2, partial [Acaulospora colombiana]